MKRRSRRYPPQSITDTDFTGDIATFSDTLQNATLLLHNIEKAVKEVCLLINKKNLDVIIQSLNGVNLKEVTDYKYLGSNIENTTKYINIRIGIAWAAMNKMSQIWKSEIPKSTKISFFCAAVESILLYGSECRMLANALSKKLDGTYTRLL